MKLIKSKGIIFLALVALSCLIFAGCPAPPAEAPPEEEVFHWRGQVCFAPGDLTNDIVMQGTFDAMEKASKGRLVIERYAADALVSVDGMFDAVSSGALDIGASVSVYYAGKLPPGLGDVMLLPLGWTDPQDFYNLWYEEGMFEIFRKAYVPHNIAYIGSGGCGRYCLQTTFPVHKLEDLEGKRIRAWGAYSYIVEEAGGAPATIPGPEIYMALKLGTIDGMFWSLPELEIMKHKEIIDYVILPPFMFPPPCDFLVNMDSWKVLPTDLQEDLIKAVEESFLPLTEEIGAEDDKALKTAGVEVITLPDTEVARFEKIAVGYWDELAAKSPEAATAIEILKDYYKMP